MDQKKGSGSSKQKQKKPLTKRGRGGRGGKQQKKTNPYISFHHLGLKKAPEIAPTILHPQTQHWQLTWSAFQSSPDPSGLSDNDDNIHGDFLVKHYDIQGEEREVDQNINNDAANGMVAMACDDMGDDEVSIFDCTKEKHQ